MNAKDIINKLKLIPHPEGGFYRETYRSNQLIITKEGQNRNTSTAIYYLLENKNKSNFHRIKSDELWFFHQGQPIEIKLIQDNKLTTIILGNDIEKGESPQTIIPENCWFASKVKNEIGFSLVSCGVAPGFDFSDFELAKRENLIQQFPHLKDVIEEFTSK